MSRTRLFFVSDVHGSYKCFRKFINASKFYGANILILAGDLTGKALVPVVRQRDGSWQSSLFGVDNTARSEEELESLIAAIRSSGFYPYRTDADELEALSFDKAEIELLFEKLAIELLEDWMELAKEKFEGSNLKCFISPGNDDILSCDQVLKKHQNENVIYSEGQALRIDEEHEMITVGWSNRTPWSSPRETSEEELERMIHELVNRVFDTRRCVFNIHVPPFNSGLDLAARLDAELRPVISGGQIERIAAGSTAVREAIKRYEPILGLHGHVHESPGFCRLGKTICLNPGSEYSEGILRGALVELDGARIRSYQLTSG